MEVLELRPRTGRLKERKKKEGGWKARKTILGEQFHLMLSEVANFNTNRIIRALSNS